MPLVLAIYAVRHVGDEPARLLFQRGCPVDGRSQMGLPMQDTLEGYVRRGGPRGEGAATVLAVIGKRK